LTKDWEESFTEDPFKGWKEYELDDDDEVAYFFTHSYDGGFKIHKLEGERLKKFRTAVDGNGFSHGEILGFMTGYALDDPNSFILGVEPSDYAEIGCLSGYL